MVNTYQLSFGQTLVYNVQVNGRNGSYKWKVVEVIPNVSIFVMKYFQPLHNIPTNLTDLESQFPDRSQLDGGMKYI